MALNETQITDIEKAMAALLLNSQPLIPGLRAQFPAIAFLQCEAGDMDSAPYLKREKYDLFLFDRSEICIRVTDTLACADGVIISARELT